MALDAVGPSNLDFAIYRWNDHSRFEKVCLAKDVSSIGFGFQAEIYVVSGKYS